MIEQTFERVFSFPTLPFTWKQQYPLFGEDAKPRTGYMYAFDENGLKGTPIVSLKNIPRVTLALFGYSSLLSDI